MKRTDVILKMQRILLRRRDALRKSLTDDLGQLGSFSHAGDAVDQAVDTAYDEINSQLVEAESRELANIQNALERVRDGEYGLCECCGDNISVARLQALPYATLCIQCQRSQERGRASHVAAADWSDVVDSYDDDPSVSYVDLSTV